VTIQVTPPTPPKKYVTVDRGVDERHHAYIIGTVGAGLVLGGVVIALVAKHEHDNTDMLDERDRWQALARYGSTPMVVVGGAAIGYAVYTYLHAPREERIEVVPDVGQSHAGVAVSGKF